MILAIDGPAGAGKSTVSRDVARRLGFQLLDTGAIYRSVAWLAQQQGIAWDDGPALAQLALNLQIRFEMRGDVNTVFLTLPDEGEVEVSTQVRAPEIGQGASQVSAHPEVRGSLLELQRRLGRAQDSVVEGRDIGTVVFPKADVKVFLTASVEERARRRHEQLKGNADAPSFESIAEQIRERDHRDMTRAVAPLKQAEDASLVDCTSMSQEEVVAAIASLVEGR